MRYYCLFVHGEEGESYYKSVRVSNSWNNNYIENESKGDRIKTLWVEEYLKIKPYLKDIINGLKESETWKIQLTIAVNFISSENSDEEHVMNSKNDKIKITINDETDEVIKELSLLAFFAVEKISIIFSQILKHKY